MGTILERAANTQIELLLIEPETSAELANQTHSSGVDGADDEEGARELLLELVGIGEQNDAVGWSLDGEQGRADGLAGEL